MCFFFFLLFLLLLFLFFFLFLLLLLLLPFCRPKTLRRFFNSFAFGPQSRQQHAACETEQNGERNTKRNEIVNETTPRGRVRLAFAFACPVVVTCVGKLQKKETQEKRKTQEKNKKRKHSKYSCKLLNTRTATTTTRVTCNCLTTIVKIVIVVSFLNQNCGIVFFFFFFEISKVLFFCLILFAERKRAANCGDKLKSKQKFSVHFTSYCRPRIPLLPLAG